MSKNGNYGSIRKLNWVAPKFEEKVTKSIPHEEAGDIRRDYGTPPTRGGHTALRPAVRTDYGPDLFLDKAILQTPSINAKTGKKQFSRKRDATGKFAPAQSAGAQSTAEEDKVDQIREDNLRQARMSDRLHGKGDPSKGQSNAKKAIPGASGSAMPMSSVNDSTSQMVGTTTSGQPIYDDPYHSAHQQFGQPEHEEAADIHGQMAQQMQASGDMAGAARHQASSEAHMQQAQDGLSPGNRFMDNLFSQQGAPEVQPEDMGQFSDLLGMGADQGMDSNPAIAGDGPEAMMAQDPMAGQDPMAQDPMAGQDPMAQDPMAQDPMAMDPMAQDPMAGQDPMAQDPMAQDPMAGGAPPQPDPLSSFLGQDSMEPSMDQNKPLAPDPMEPGPKPGMIDSATGGPIGEQTDVSGAGEEDYASFDMSELMDEAHGMGAEPDMGANPDMGAGEEDVDVPESNAGFPGPDAGYNEEEEPVDEDKATFKALRALSRYV